MRNNIIREPNGPSQNQRYPGNSKVPQYAAAAAACMGAFGLGTVLGWSSTGIPSLKEDEDFKDIGEESESWIGAGVPAGAIFAGAVTGIFIAQWGRKLTMLMLSVPFVFSWLLITYAQNLSMIIIGRVISGFCGGAFSLVCPVFISETAESHIRGTLSSGFQLMVTIGILFTYAVGAGVKWYWLALICGFGPLALLIIMIFIPESPRYLLSKGKTAEATKALCWLRATKSSQDVEEEIKEFQDSLDEVRSRGKASFGDILKHPNIKPVSISLMLMFFQQFSGINAVIFYTVSIFEASGSKMDNNVQAIIIGVVQVVATLVSTVVVDRLGRRILLFVSGMLMGVSLVALGIFFQIKPDTPEEMENISYGWLPLVSLILFIIAFSLGYGPIPWMMIGEILPLSVKELASAVTTCFNWILAFIITKFFVSVEKAIDIQYIYWFFAAVCFLSVICVFIFLPETKGKSLEEIQEYFGGSRPLITNNSNGNPSNVNNTNYESNRT